MWRGRGRKASARGPRGAGARGRGGDRRRSRAAPVGRGPVRDPPRASRRRLAPRRPRDRRRRGVPAAPAAGRGGARRARGGQARVDRGAGRPLPPRLRSADREGPRLRAAGDGRVPHALAPSRPPGQGDRKSTRLNSSHGYISYAVFCLKKKKKPKQNYENQLIENYTRIQKNSKLMR